jgi:hypothetical protein
MPLFLFVNTQTMHIKSIVHNSIVRLPKNFIPWRDWNPGLPATFCWYNITKMAKNYQMATKYTRLP